MGQYKTPGVYIVEKNAFPSSVVEVATAVPAFIGYTERADNNGKTLLNKAWRISSMSEFINFYGGAPKSTFEIQDKPEGDASVESDFSSNNAEYHLEHQGVRFFLYHSMMLFFQNGGGACYIVSVGKHGDAIEKPKLDGGLKILLKEQEPTMVVIPDAMSLSQTDGIALQQAMLKHCGFVMKSRFAILDIFDGDKDIQDSKCIENFRNNLGINFLDYAAAYYPWLNTTIVQTSNLSFENIANLDQLQALLNTEVDNSQLIVAKKNEVKAQIEKLNANADAVTREELHKALNVVSPLYGKILQAIRSRVNLLPPSAAMAGIYSMVDNSRGVWKAPANVSLNSVISPSVEITHDEQEDLNITTMGKSINAIRSFIGEGTLIWGARTLDGNSLDWRYINVRRTMIMLEESVKLASKAYVFEANVSGTWVTIKSMIQNFLTSIWKRGGLAGATPDDAFGVYVGLGETMTPQDILDGILRVTVLVALSRPAEFIEITFQQQMQKS